jgi:ribosome-associated translation inhibitor RaiA
MEKIGEFVLTIMHSATNTHILHLRASTISEHLALGEFYQAIPELIDALAEAIQGRLEEKISYPVTYYGPADTGLEELQSLKEYVDENRSSLPENSEIQNLVDELADQINSTLNKLKFYK